MKLLTRSKVAAEAASNKKAMIDEGVRIATRVDALRKTLADLETQHKQYITAITEEGITIRNKLVGEISLLEAEIKVLSEKRDALLVPLDAEWARVNEKAKELESLIESTKKAEIIAHTDKNRAKIALNKINERLSRFRVRENALAKSYQDAEEKHAEAEQILKQIKHEKEIQDQAFAQREQELDKKERANDFTEAALINKGNLQDAKDLELNDKERQINDKYATLLRTINRLK